jgi:hypothetical protein
VSLLARWYDRAVRCSAAILLLLLAGAGCAGPPSMGRDEIDDDGLRVIVEAYDRRVAEARADPELTWHSGWVGNVVSIVLGPAHGGLCYHWQEWVYTGVRSTAWQVGWTVQGIALNVNRSGEHHAVLVFDPQRLEQPGPLVPAPARNAFVLDAWRRGRADVYRLPDWLAIPAHRGVTIELEDLEVIPLLKFHPSVTREAARDAADTGARGARARQCAG